MGNIKNLIKKKRMINTPVIRTLLIIILLFIAFVSMSACELLSPLPKINIISTCCIVSDSTGNIIGCANGYSESNCHNLFAADGDTLYITGKCSEQIQCSSVINNCFGYSFEYNGIYNVSDGSYICNPAGESHLCQAGATSLVEDCAAKSMICKSNSGRCISVIGPDVRSFGDADGSADIGGSDLNALVMTLSGILVVCNPVSDCSNLDLDGDGVIDNDDKIIMSNMLSGDYTNKIGYPSQIQVINPPGIVMINNQINLITQVTDSDGTPRSGIGVLFSIDESSTAYATLHGRDPNNEVSYTSYTDGNSVFEITNGISIDNGLATIQLTALSPGNLVINLYVPGDPIKQIADISNQIVINAVACTPDCSTKCAGWPDGCDGLCSADASSCTDPNTGKNGVCRVVSGQKQCKNPNLVLEYSFSQSGAIDTSGNNYDGITKNNIVYVPTEGILGTGAYKFSGGNQHILNNTEISNIVGISNQITLSAWVNHTQLENTQRYITLGNEKAVIRYDSRTGYGFHFYIKIGDALKEIKSNIYPEINKWYHIVGTYDGINMKFYINGKLVKSQLMTGTLNTVNKGLLISSSGSTESMRGIIDEIKVYNKALSDSEVMQLCQENDPGGLCGV